MDATLPPSAGGGESEVASFSSFIPPPYRVLLLVSIGLLLFGSNFHLLALRGIDLWSLVRSHNASSKAPEDDVDGEVSVHGSELGRGKVDLLPLTRLGGANGNADGHRSASADRPSGQRSTSPFYAFGIGGAIWSLLGWFSYRYYVDQLSGDAKGRHAQALQAIAVLGAFGALLWPGNMLHRPIRRAFGRAVLRILSPSLSQTVTFADVLLADVLTSFAKVFGDVWLTACFLVPRKEHHTWWNGKGSVVVPLLISLPYAIRFRQCVSEYRVTNAKSKPRSARLLTGGGAGRADATNKKPLWNAAKYASAFPVIWLSAWYDADTVVGESGEWNARFTFWLLSVFVNSLYSFWWDVTNDWGLSILSTSVLSSVSPSLPRPSTSKALHKRGVSSFSFLQHHGQRKTSTDDCLPLQPRDSIDDGDLGMRSASKQQQQPHLLAPPSSSLSSSPSIPSSSSSGTHARQPSLLETVLRPPSSSAAVPSLLFHPTTYQLAILLDLVLRFFWSLKLSSHLHHVVEWQGGVFVMEALEVVRRWVWLFFRVEWEVVRRHRTGSGTGTGTVRQD